VRPPIALAVAKPAEVATEVAAEVAVGSGVDQGALLKAALKAVSEGEAVLSGSAGPCSG
jgi:hypothetical protein